MAGVIQVDLGDLDVPLGTFVQLEFITPPARHMVKVLGAIPGRSLIVSCPTSKGRKIFVREGQAINVRLMLGTAVCAFSSRVAKSYLEPAAHLHLAYPAYVETSVVRETVRVETRLICSLEPNTNENTISEATSGIVVDLSAGGAKLISKEDFGAVKQRMRLAMNLKISGYNFFLKVDCEIRSQEIQMLEQLQSSLVDNDFLSRMDAEYFYVYGLRFEDLTKEVVIPLTAYILEHQKKKAR
ncbi:flagellar brake protein [Marinomonas pollencensis]|uniref:Flagellar protein YcgR n=1 Tax=Marinomonas pollencensis TaxID=491954 RepID=A0A3E0DVR3_9GAMM|nr:flagellar brake protein [Marinomonas pollencensis]REG85749.1 flagellar protein YcgR [Marinomonas pollencensis]